LVCARATAIASPRPAEPPVTSDTCGTSTPDTQALAGALAAAHPRDQITLSVTRGGKDLDVKLTLGELPGD
jgi:hypothetical protein